MNKATLDLAKQLLNRFIVNGEEQIHAAREMADKHGYFFVDALEAVKAAAAEMEMADKRGNFFITALEADEQVAAEMRGYASLAQQILARLRSEHRGWAAPRDAVRELVASHGYSLGEALKAVEATLDQETGGV